MRVAAKYGGLNGSMQHLLGVYWPEFQSPKFSWTLLAAQTNAAAATNLLSQHHLPEAIALAQAVSQQAPDSADANAVLGLALLASNRIGESQQAIATALHLAQTIHPSSRSA